MMTHIRKIYQNLVRTIDVNVILNVNPTFLLNISLKEALKKHFRTKSQIVGCFEEFAQAWQKKQRQNYYHDDRQHVHIIEKL